MPARSRAFSGGSDSRRATMLRTASVSAETGRGREAGSAAAEWPPRNLMKDIGFFLPAGLRRA